MSKIRSLLRISVSNLSISIRLCNYFTVRQISSYPKNARVTNNNKLTQNFIKSFPPKLHRFYPLFAVVTSCIGNYRLVTTCASVDELVLSDKDLDRLISSLENDPVSGKETCICYIEKLSLSGNLLGATRLVQGLRDKQVFLNPKTYNVILVAAGEGNHFDFVSQIFKDLLLSSNFLLSQDSYLSLANAFLKSTDTKSLLKLVREVSELTFPRSSTIINRILSSFAKSRQIDKALVIFDHMKDLKCKPDIVTYNTVLAILGRAGRVDELLHEFASMKETKMVPDIISYNTLITSLRKMGRLDLCLDFLQEMVDRGHEPDLLTYTALIEGFGRSGRSDEAVRLLGEMKKRNVRPSIYIYRSLISNLKRTGKFEVALSLETEMNSCISDLVGPKDFKRNHR